MRRFQRSSCAATHPRAYSGIFFFYIRVFRAFFLFLFTYPVVYHCQNLESGALFAIHYVFVSLFITIITSNVVALKAERIRELSALNLHLHMCECMSTRVDRKSASVPFHV